MMKRLLFLCMMGALFLAACDIFGEGTENGDNYMEKGKSYLESQQYGKAIDAYTKAIQQYKYNSDHNKKALAYIARGAAKTAQAIVTKSKMIFEDAKDDFTTAINIAHYQDERTEMIARLGRGRARYGLEKYYEALSDYTTVIDSGVFSGSIEENIAKQGLIEACAALPKRKDIINSKCENYLEVNKGQVVAKNEL